MKKYLLVITLSLLLSGCESSDMKIPARFFGLALGALILYFIASFINKGENHKEKEIFLEFNNRSRHPTRIETIENNMKSSENTDASVKIYRYKKASKIFLIIGLLLLVLGFVFKDAEGYVEIPIYYHGIVFNIFAVIMLVLTVIIYLSENLIEYKTHTYKLYNNRIACYNDQDIELFSINVSDIYKIDIDYKYTDTKGGEMLTGISYQFKTTSDSTLHKIEVKGLRNIDSKKSFRDEFSEQIKNFI